MAGARAGRSRPHSATRPDRPTHARCRRSTQSQRSLPGQVQFVDNLSDALNTAAGDALYADTLYIMLALPGALVGLALAYSGRARDGRARRAGAGAAAGPRREKTRPARARGARERRARRDRRAARHRPRAGRGQVADHRRGERDDGPRAHRRRGMRGARRRRRVRGSARGRRHRVAAEHQRKPSRVPPADQGAVAAPVPRPLRAGTQRPDLLAHGQHRLLGGGQPGLQPDSLAVGVHVLRAGAAVDRGDAVARPPPRARAGVGGRAGSAAAEPPARPRSSS